MQLSILVISRTAELVNRFCAGLDAACSLSPIEAEILVSVSYTHLTLPTKA